MALDTSVLELDKLDKIEGGREELQKKVKGLQKKIEYQKCQIKDYCEIAEEGKVAFEKVCQDCEILSNRVLGEEKKIFLAKQNHDVARMLSSNIQKGLSRQNIVATSPLSLVDKLRFQEFLFIGLCPFCGLGFAPLWVGKITSCKHVYRC